MERYLGADVHAASVTFCMLDASGKPVRRDVVETNGSRTDQQVLEAALRKDGVRSFAPVVPSLYEIFKEVI